MRRVNVLTLSVAGVYGCLVLIGKFPIRNGQAERQRRNRCSLRVTGHRVRARTTSPTPRATRSPTAAATGPPTSGTTTRSRAAPPAPGPATGPAEGSAQLPGGPSASGLPGSAASVSRQSHLGSVRKNSNFIERTVADSGSPAGSPTPANGHPAPARISRVAGRTRVPGWCRALRCAVARP